MKCQRLWHHLQILIVLILWTIVVLVISGNFNFKKFSHLQLQLPVIFHTSMDIQETHSPQIINAVDLDLSGKNTSKQKSPFFKSNLDGNSSLRSLGNKLRGIIGNIGTVSKISESTRRKLTQSQSPTQQILINDLKHLHFRDMFNKTISSNLAFGREIIIDKTKYLIYRCDTNSMRHCGGWADRIKGMMAAYIIANLTRRVFKSEIIIPNCDIQRFIQPNQVNWSLPVSFHKIIKKSPDVTKVNLIDNVHFWSHSHKINLQSLWPVKTKYVYYKSNLDYMTQFKNNSFYKEPLSWMQGLNVGQINAAIYKRLFKISPEVEYKLNDFLSGNLMTHDKLVCAHIRTGRGQTLPNDTVFRFNEKNIHLVWHFLKELIEKNQFQYYKVFVMSDAESIIANARKQSFGDKLLTVPGEVVHPERSLHVTDKVKCEATGKVILEQHILMHCDVLLISKSGLSRMSAYIRASDDGLYCIFKDGKILPCRVGDIKAMYKVMG